MLDLTNRYTVLLFLHSFNQKVHFSNDRRIIGLLIPEKKIQPSNWSIFFVHPVFSFAIYQIFTWSEIGNTNGRVLENSVNSAKLHQKTFIRKKNNYFVHLCMSLQFSRTTCIHNLYKGSFGGIFRTHWKKVRGTRVNFRFAQKSPNNLQMRGLWIIFFRMTVTS